eukprot:TRINITY_DN1776_c0_g1_i2.p1 TRINITY_DN1776_c0_g1~~TRINITY_DN1776_c0_g1_i2.p1  ORF type:complete len:201 (+),score=47.19 TRINITY_DN1776_c0_g1_i2:69-605(+)
MSAWSSVSSKSSFHTATPAMADVLTHLIERASEEHSGKAELPLFDGGFSSVSAKRLLVRLTRESEATPSTFVTTFILLDRWATHAQLTKRTVHRAIAAAFVTAAMLSDDGFQRFGHYARLFSMPVEDLHELFRAFICAIDFNLSVPAELYAGVEDRLSDHGRRVLRRAARSHGGSGQQ